MGQAPQGQLKEPQGLGSVERVTASRGQPVLGSCDTPGPSTHPKATKQEPLRQLSAPLGLDREERDLVLHNEIEIRLGVRL